MFFGLLITLVAAVAHIAISMLVSHVMRVTEPINRTTLATLFVYWSFFVSVSKIEFYVVLKTKVIGQPIRQRF